jgi:hypothetical protein
VIFCIEIDQGHAFSCDNSLNTEERDREKIKWGDPTFKDGVEKCSGFEDSVLSFCLCHLQVRLKEGKALGNEIR